MKHIKYFFSLDDEVFASTNKLLAIRACARRRISHI